MEYKYHVTKGLFEKYNVCKTEIPYVPPNLKTNIVFEGTIVECAAFMYLINNNQLDNEE